MTSIKRVLCAALALAAMTTGVQAQTETRLKPGPRNEPDIAPAQPMVTPADIQALKDGLAEAQREIQALREELQRTNLAVQQARAIAAVAARVAGSTQVRTTADFLESDVATLTTPGSPGANNAKLEDAVMTLQEPTQSSNPESSQVFNKEMEGPLTIRFKGINVTPGGFAEAAFVWRSRALGADLTTPFNSLTMPGASQSHVPEFFGSARQSRPTVFVAGRLGSVELSSYVSGDFLSAGVTSTATQTNSYTFRLRQVWGQAKFDNGWSFLGGQMWSLVTENRVGIAPSDDTGRTNDARPMTIDPAYNVGFSFARQYGIRATKRMRKNVWLAVAMENAQLTLTTHGNVSNFLLGELGASNSYNSTATYSFNPSPDLIAKIAVDPGFGHYEVFGLVNRFADRIFPCVEFTPTNALCTASGATATTGAFNASREGGGLGANARWSLAGKHLSFGLHGFGGSGVGRYGAGQLSDVSINAGGAVRPIKNLQGLSTLEWHGRKLDIYLYGGAEYAARTWAFDALQNKGKGAEVGYGAPGFINTGCYAESAPGSTTVGFTPGSLIGCTGDTRALIEGTLGFWYRFYSGPRGRFQYGMQYSYVTRNTWSGAGGLPAGSGGLEPNGIDGIVFSSFRYYLP